MGWDSNPHWSSYKEAIYELFQGSEIVDISIKPNYAFIASKHHKHGYVYATMARLSKVDGDIAVKLVDESMGPAHYTAPQRLMGRLTPLEEIEAVSGEWPHAREWRERVEAYHRNNRQTKLLPNDCVRFDDALIFPNGLVEQDFKVCVRARKTLFISRKDGKIYRITGYKQYTYKLLEGDERW